jgi:hypothetical protein
VVIHTPVRPDSAWAVSAPLIIATGCAWAQLDDAREELSSVVHTSRYEMRHYANWAANAYPMQNIRQGGRGDTLRTFLS